MPDTLPRTRYIRDTRELGWLEGVTINSASSEASEKKPLCHFFGGIPYGLPPIDEHRFRQARPLPQTWRYGTRSNPARFTGECSVCPQPKAKGATGEKHWDENCLQLNIYIPVGAPPPKGWPVFFYIHGGFLQCGSPNNKPEAMARLLGETEFQAIIVAPAYRLNVLGFLASRELQSEAYSVGEPAGNQGLWDQRLALEWTARNIRVFDGDAENITVGGYSAGAYSVFHQLAHELFQETTRKPIIRRVIMWGNGPGVQPRSMSEQQRQFDELLGVLDISLALPVKEKLQRLRATAASKLVAAIEDMRLTEFKPWSDGIFVPRDLFKHINKGEFARRMKQRGIALMNGECRDEHHVYQQWRTPLDSYDAMYTRLCADYPERAVKAILAHHCGGGGSKQALLPAGMKDWREAFGHIYANTQIHLLERGFNDALVRGGLEVGKDLLRYRIEWRAKLTDGMFPLEWGVTHSSDLAIWFWGMNIGGGLSEDEKRVLRPWNERFARFVQGKDVPWAAGGEREMLRLNANGETEVWTDEDWEEGVELWRVVNGGVSPGLLSWMKSRL
jgi:carboxylesterase type B